MAILTVRTMTVHGCEKGFVITKVFFKSKAVVLVGFFEARLTPSPAQAGHLGTVQFEHMAVVRGACKCLGCMLLQGP